MSERLKLAEYFVEHYSTVAVGALQQMPTNAAGEMIEAIDDSISVSTLRSMLPAAAAKCLASVPPDSSAKYLNRMGAKEVAAILRHMKESRRKELLRKLSRRHSVRVSILLRYPRPLVGAWMDSVTVCFQTKTSISDAKLQVVDEGYAYSDIYVVGDDNRVLGAVPFIDLMQLSETDGSVAVVMKPAAKPIYASLTLRQAIEWSDWSEQDTLPVIDRDQKLIGIVRFVDLWGAMTASSSFGRNDVSNSQVFGITEVCCLGLADLMTAVLSQKSAAT